jgi:hypothetical protein
MENEFKNPEDVIEWTLITHGIIKAFEDRGYGLYPLGKGPMMFTNIEMIMEFVQYGRVEEVLEVGIRHLPLPLIEDSKDTFQMSRAYEEMIHQLRGPYFVDIGINAEGRPEALGKYLIDTIAVFPPGLHLSVDVKFGQVTTDNTIVLHLAEAANVIRKQLMMSLRTVTMQAGGRKSDAPLLL